MEVEGLTSQKLYSLNKEKTPKVYCLWRFLWVMSNRNCSQNLTPADRII